jgi:WD40 repeat protein
MLIGTRNAGVIYLHAGTAQLADATSGLPDNQITSITTSETHAYVGTPTGTADFDLSSSTFRPSRILAPNLFSHALAVAGDQLHIGTLDQGIHPIPLSDTPRLTRASISIGPAASSTQRIDAFLPTPTSLYALADGTLLRHDANAWLPAIPTTPNTLSDRNISALAFAPDGTLYIGFFDHGLDILRPDNSLHHLEDDHLFCINRLALDPQRHTMAAATANGLVLFDANGNPRQTLSRHDGLISDHITDIAFTPSGTTLATPAGLTFLTPTGPESLYAFQGLVNNHVYALAYSNASNQLLAGTLGGISVLQSTSIQSNFTATNSSLRHNWITALQPLPNNTILVGTYGAGLETLDRSGRFTPVDLPSGTPRDLVINPNALLATATHIFAGTLAHGMLVYSTASGRWTSVTAGLPSLNVTAFAARSGTLYIGTANGLVRIPEANIP